MCNFRLTFCVPYHKTIFEVLAVNHFKDFPKHFCNAKLFLSNQFCIFDHHHPDPSNSSDTGLRTEQYKLDFSGLSGRSTSNARDEEGNSGMQGSDSKGSATSEASM